MILKWSEWERSVYHQLYRAPSWYSQQRGRSMVKGQRMANHQLARRNSPQRSRRSRDTPDSTASREPRSQHGWSPVSTDCSGRWPRTCGRTGITGKFTSNQSRVTGLHVTKEQVGPDFVHVVTKPFTSIQNIHQLFNRRTSSPNWTPVLRCFWAHLSAKSWSETSYLDDIFRLCWQVPKSKIKAVTHILCWFATLHYKSDAARK